MYNINIKIITLLSLCLSVELSTEEGPVFRIVNGRFATLGQFPYQVALKRRIGREFYHSFCGGALIRADKVLTAAQCVTDDNKNFCARACFSVKYKNRRLSAIYVVAATLVTNGTQPSSGDEQSRRLSKIIAHKDFDFPKSDIAILLTSKPFTLNSDVGVLPYATKIMNYGTRQCLVSGYGRISKTEISEYLMWTRLWLIPSRQCSRYYRQEMRHYICTRNSRFADVLQGDSGSALVCSNTTDPADKGKGVIVGIVCGSRPRVGAYFTRVTSFKKFIESKAIVTELPSGLIVFFLVLLRFLYCCRLDYPLLPALN